MDRKTEIIQGMAAMGLAFVDSWSPARYWQPIETAPKDGTSILLFGPDDWEGRPWQEVARYSGSEMMPWDGLGRHVPWVPTHWMPLPKPPVTPEEDVR